MASKKLKKALRQKVAKTLTDTFEDLKEGISSRKFKRNIRKASKMLLSGLKVTPKKKTGEKEPASGKRLKKVKATSQA